MRKSNPNAKATDVIVGQRIQLARQLGHVSQEKLAAAIGVTFQQVQKYESAHNRVSASRLAEIARFLGRPISFFFEGVDVTIAESDPLTSTEALQVVRGYFRQPEEKRPYILGLLAA